MAMIQCPECGKEISDKAKKCIHCGGVFIEEKPANGEIRCSECGAVLAETDEICPRCGCPVEKVIKQEDVKPQQVEVASIKMAVKTKKIIIGIIIAIIVCAGGGVGYKIYSDNKAEQRYRESYNEYIDNLGKVQILMLSGGSDAESLCNLTLKVWGNAIYKKSDSETNKYTREWDYADLYTRKFHDDEGKKFYDFDTALAKLYADSSTTEKVSNIESNQSSVKDLIKKLQNPLEGLDKCYNTVYDLYETYKILTDLATNPSGSYEEFGTKKSDAVLNFTSLYEKLDNQIPEKLKDK